MSPAASLTCNLVSAEPTASPIITLPPAPIENLEETSPPSSVAIWKVLSCAPAEFCERIKG